MPFSGYLVYTGRFNIWLVGVAGAFGCLVGSLVAYWWDVRWSSFDREVRAIRSDFGP